VSEGLSNPPPRSMPPTPQQLVALTQATESSVLPVPLMATTEMSTSDQPVPSYRRSVSPAAQQSLPKQLAPIQTPGAPAGDRCWQGGHCPDTRSPPPGM
jgi:hypothetical protein